MENIKFTKNGMYLIEYSKYTQRFTILYCVRTTSTFSPNKYIKIGTTKKENKINTIIEKYEQTKEPLK